MEQAQSVNEYAVNTLKNVEDTTNKNTFEVYAFSIKPKCSTTTLLLHMIRVRTKIKLIITND